MLWCQMRARAKLNVGETLRLGQVAQLSAHGEAASIPLPCPRQEGVWKISAIEVASTLAAALPGEEIRMLGGDVCYVHVVHADRPDPLRFLRTAAAFAIMLLGSALGLCWFHSDVDMPNAQAMVYRLLTGQEVSDIRWITVPYIIGVAVGVAVFYALPGRRAVTPMEVKLTEYQEDMEKTEGRDKDDP